MKKILISAIVILSVFLIYLCNMDKKVYYLALGDSLAYGEGPNNKKIKGYSDYVKDYLTQKNLLETYIPNFAEKGQRTYDLINLINDNKKITINKKNISIQNALIKADLVTLSIGANDILNKIDTNSYNKNQIYNYIDELTKDLNKLLKLMREYCKEDIILVGYYNPYYIEDNTTTEIFNYLNKKYKEIAKEYNVKYIEIDTIFKENPNFLSPNDIHPTKEGYKAISGEIIGQINKTLLNTWFL